MAFSYGSPSGGGTNANVQMGPDLLDIQTEVLGFSALAGDAKVQLLSPAWPADRLPPPTSSLMSVASRKGLVAAAGPDAVMIARTESVRKAFQGSNSGNGNIKSFQPELKLPMPMRVSQLAFTADESYLVLSAEEGGGLAVYDVQAILQGSTDSAFQISTNGQSLRALVPNPTPEKGELLALVTNNGNLMMANLKTREFVSGPNGQALKTGVSCVSWSTKGKQLVAGLGDGTAYQMTPEGESKAHIPAPPNDTLSESHVSSITWLENNVFLMVHTPSDEDGGMVPASIFHIVTRKPIPAQPGQLPAAAFRFQKISEPAGPYGMHRSPPHHFVARLTAFPPNIQDILVVGSSAATDIGLLTRSKAPLAQNKPAAEITEVFTMTEMLDDSRRAQLPISKAVAGDSMSETPPPTDTCPIGMALDLSSKDKVEKPIPSQEMDESPTPVPALLVLNNEGVLSAWWIIYSESVRQGTMYPGLVAAPSTQQPTQQIPAPASTSAFGASLKPAFGASTFGTAGSEPAFGAAKPTSVFGAPAYGAPAASGASSGTFGSTSGLGQKKSVWGTPSAVSSTGSSSNTPAFGSTAFGSAPASSAASGSSAFGGTSGTSVGGGIFGSKHATTLSASNNGGTFGAPTFGSSNTVPSGGGIFGSKPPVSSPASSGGAVGQSAFGSTPAVLAITPAFGAPSFGATSTPAMGNRVSPWATGASTAPSVAFGQSGGLGKPASPFGTPTASSESAAASASSGFAAFATSGGFAAAGSTSKPGESIFGAKAATSSPFGAPSTSNSVFDGSKSDNKLNPFGSGGFKIESSFKPDHNDKDKDDETADDPKTSFFSSGFDNALGTASMTPTAATSVVKSTDSSPIVPKEASKLESTTPTSIPAAPKPGLYTTSSGSSGMFGSSPAPASKIPVPTGFSFGQPSDQPAAGASSPPPAEKPKINPFGPAILKPSIAPGPKTPTFDAPKSELSSFTPATARTPLSPKIKQEPTETPISKIPEAPLPPDSTIEAPLPPEYVPEPAPKSAAPPPMSVQKPIAADMIPPSDVPGGPEDDVDDSDFLTEEDGSEHSEEASEEGSGEDVTKDFEDVTKDLGTSGTTRGFTPERSFAGGVKAQAAQKMGFSNPSNPSQEPRTLFGEIGRQAPVLMPPKVDSSPRSPSPVRMPLPVPHRMQRHEPFRSSSAPGVPSRMSGSMRASTRPAVPSFSSLALSVKEEKALEKRRAEAQAQKEAEETQVLLDEEDERMRDFLKSEIIATRTLDEFVAHADYVSDESKNSIPSQVETVYRDINSMIDTLGINARSLKSFTKGHEEQNKDGGRDREDLEDEDDWCLVEVHDLSAILEQALPKELAGSRVREVDNKFETCNSLLKDLSRLRAKHEDIKKIIDAQLDPKGLAVARSQPLSAEQIVQQNDLRKKFTDFQKLLVEAEEALSLLKAQFVSQSMSSGKGTSGPTVENVLRTITKMTSMAEKRSGDVDVLEGQMRRLGFSSSISPVSRERSPFGTPMRASTRQSTYGLFYTPESGKETPSNSMREYMQSSIGSLGNSPQRKKLSGYTTEEKEKLRMKLAKRKAVTNRLKAGLREVGTKVRPIDDYE